MVYYDDIAGGSHGGWTPAKEQEVRLAIAAGVADALAGDGRTLGQRLLATGQLEDEAYLLRLRSHGRPLLARSAGGVLPPPVKPQGVAATLARLRSPQGVWDVLAATTVLAATVALLWVTRQP